MTRIKSLVPNGVPKGPEEVPSGYSHRTHRSKKGRKKEIVFLKQQKRMRKELLMKWEKRHNND